MRVLKWLLGIVGAGALAGVAFAVWLLGTEGGLRWALRFAPAELEIEAPRGALARTISFERLAYRGSEARKVSFEVNLLALAADTISIESLHAESVKLTRPDGPAGSAPAPFPFRIRIADAHVNSLTLEGYEMRDLRADYSGSASGHELQAAFSAFGARAEVKASLGTQLSLSAEVRALDLASLAPAAPHTALDLKLSGHGSTASLAGTLVIVNADPGPLDRERLPVGRAQAAFSTDFKSLTLQQMKASLHPVGTIDGKGSARLDGASFDTRIEALDLRALYSSLRETRLSGPLVLDLARERQRVHGTLAQEDMSLTADAERRGESIEVRALRARAGESEATGSGRIQLGEPLKFSADLKLARFDPSRFGDYPVGSINGSVKVNGDLSGAGSASWQVAHSTLLGQTLASTGRAELAGERIVAADAWLQLGANRASAKGSFGTSQDRLQWTMHVPNLAALREGFGGELRASGTAGGTWKQPSAVVDATASGLRLSQALSFERATLKGSGTLERHEGEVTARSDAIDLKASLRGGWRSGAWRGEIVSLKNAGAYPFELKTPTALEASAGRVALGRFQAELAGGHAAVDSLSWENGRIASSGAIKALPASWVLAALHAENVAGDLLVEGEWQLVYSPQLNGRVALRRAGGDLVLGETAVELSRATLDARLTDGAVAAYAEVISRAGTARAEGKAAGLAPDSALTFTAEIEARELRQLTEALWTQARVSGRLGASLRGAGTLGKPEISGTLRGDALALEAPPWGIAWRDGRLRAELEANRLRVAEARIAGGEGTLSAKGTLALGARDAALEWQAERFTLLGRPDMRAVVSGNGTASFDGKKLGLIGELRVENGRFERVATGLPRLDDDVEVMGRESAPARKRAPLPIDLDLKLDLGKRLTLRAYGFNGGVAGQVRVLTNAAGALLAQGRVQAVNAKFRAYGQELEVDPGMLVFDGPLENPGLDITAWRRHQQVEAGVHVTGTIETPRVDLVSNPPVSEGEKLSWLMLGRAPTDASPADLAVLQAAGGAVFGRGDDVPLQKRFAARLGLDELGVRSSSALAGNVVALGKRYADNLYLTFERAIGTTTDYLVKLDYALTQRLSLRGQTGTTSGVGVFYRYSWD